MSGTPSSPGQSPLYSPKSWGRGLTGSWSMPLARERGCSARNPAALEQWSPGNIALCARRQRGILRSAARLVRPGGRLLYSTCTFAPEENERTVGAFLVEHPDFVLEDLGAVGFGRPGFSAPAVSAFSLPEDGPLSAAIPFERCRRILPQDGGEGHFLALFRKKGDAGASLFSAVQTKFDTFGIEIQKLYNECFCSKPEGAFQRFGRIIRLLPASLPDLRGLPILGAGCAAAEIKETGRGAVRLEPCHALFMAVQAEDCRRLLDLDLTDPRLAAFLRGEEIDAPGCAGWTAVAASGVVTGFGKASGGRLKNRYPKGPAPAGRRIDREEQGMITLQPVQDEAGYRLVRQIESRICAAQPARWHFHHGNLGVDRYFFGSGAADFFSYAHLVLLRGNPVGYALVYRPECTFHLALLPPYTAETAASALRAVEACFPEGAVPGTDASRLDLPLVAALRACGYREGSESRFQAVCPLAAYRGTPASIAPLYVAPLEDRDIADRVRYAAPADRIAGHGGNVPGLPPLGGRQHRFGRGGAGSARRRPRRLPVLVDRLGQPDRHAQSCRLRGGLPPAGDFKKLPDPRPVRNAGQGPRLRLCGYRYPQPPRCRPV